MPDLKLDSNDETNSPLESNSATVLATIEERAIFDALSETDGVQKEAARLLGISPRTLSRRLKTYEERTTSQV